MKDSESNSLGGLIELFSNKPVAVLTGAGISTDSGIPDYRGAGSPERKPMQISEFLNDNGFRKRFWAGSSVNMQNMTSVHPNAGHKALAALEQKGLINGVITQNVDGLHRAAGTETLVELHGNGHTVVCVSCRKEASRAQVNREFKMLNPNFMERSKDSEIAPDGDADVSGFEKVAVPVCRNCGGMLRPQIVYFGETVPKDVFQKAADLVEGAEALLVLGSSLVVNTGMRLVNIARKKQIPIGIVNRGKTGADPYAATIIDGGVSETLEELLEKIPVNLRTHGTV